MHARAEASDRPSPSPGADLLLVAALLGVLTSVAWGVIWVQNAAQAEAGLDPWLGAVPPVAAAACGAGLLAVRTAYGPLPRLRRFVTRMAIIGLVGAGVLAVGVAWVALR